MEALGRVELPTNGLGNRCSIHLSYGATAAGQCSAEPLRHAPIISRWFLKATLRGDHPVAYVDLPCGRAYDFE